MNRRKWGQKSIGREKSTSTLLLLSLLLLLLLRAACWVYVSVCPSPLFLSLQGIAFLYSACASLFLIWITHVIFLFSCLLLFFRSVSPFFGWLPCTFSLSLPPSLAPAHVDIRPARCVDKGAPLTVSCVVCLGVGGTVRHAELSRMRRICCLRVDESKGKDTQREEIHGQTDRH